MERSEIRNLMLRGAAAVGIAAFGAKATETVVNQDDIRFVTTAYARHADLDFSLICTDPEGDEHPAKVDILKVEKAQGNGRTHFRFTLFGDVTNNRSQLGPDVGLGIGFADANGQVEHILQAKGAERTSNTVVHLERLSEAVQIVQGPAIPLRVDEILHEEGPSSIEANADGKIVTFSVDSQAIADLPSSFVPFTTEGQGHGNRPTQVINKDTCEPIEVEVPTPGSTPTHEATSIVVPPKETPQLPESFPDTGDGQMQQTRSAKEMGLLAGLVTLTGAGLIGSLFIKNKRR